MKMAGSWVAQKVASMADDLGLQMAAYLVALMAEMKARHLVGYWAGTSVEWMVAMKAVYLAASTVGRWAVCLVAKWADKLVASWVVVRADMKAARMAVWWGD